MNWIQTTPKENIAERDNSLKVVDPSRSNVYIILLKLYVWFLQSLGKNRIFSFSVLEIKKKFIKKERIE